MPIKFGIDDYNSGARRTRCHTSQDPPFVFEKQHVQKSGKRFSLAALFLIFLCTLPRVFLKMRSRPLDDLASQPRYSE